MTRAALKPDSAFAPPDYSLEQPAAADADVIYTKYSIDKYALLMHTNAHENNTEHTGSSPEKGRSTHGRTREDFIGSFGA